MDELLIERLEKRLLKHSKLRVAVVNTGDGITIDAEDVGYMRTCVVNNTRDNLNSLTIIAAAINARRGYVN